MRLYPSSEQKIQIDRIFRALHIAYNITFHEVFKLNPQVCTSSKKSEGTWPDFKKMQKKEWRHYLISQNPSVETAPADSLMGANGIFASDAKKAWETGMHNCPVSPEKRKEFRFYNSEKPRRSFFAQIPSKNIVLSPENPKVAHISIPKVGAIKARGFNNKLRFSDNGKYTYTEAVKQNALPKKLSVRISKDTCGDYFISITFYEGKTGNYPLFIQTPAVPKEDVQTMVGIDVGIKDIAILSTGQKFENKHFKREKKNVISRLNKKLSRKWGPANMAYRDYNQEIRKSNKNNPDTVPVPLAKPSKKYLATQKKKALIERKISRRRDTYYHQQTANIIRHTEGIAIETLHISNMLRNHKLAYALSDAAMSSFTEKLKYKAERFNVKILYAGTFEPTSQICSRCGEQNPDVKNLSIRQWTCPNCGEHHDRDINAAKNILKIALEKGETKDVLQEKPLTKKKAPHQPKSKNIIIFPDCPEITIVFSKELTKNNDPRYVIQNSKTHKILDDAQGMGYRSASNAKNCYKAKVKYSKTLNLK
jgi:transposase